MTKNYGLILVEIRVKLNILFMKLIPVPIVRSVSYITANIYCKLRYLPNTDVRNYSIDLR